MANPFDIPAEQTLIDGQQFAMGLALPEITDRNAASAMMRLITALAKMGLYMHNVDAAVGREVAYSIDATLAEPVEQYSKLTGYVRKHAVGYRQLLGFRARIGSGGTIVAGTQLKITDTNNSVALWRLTEDVVLPPWIGVGGQLLSPPVYGYAEEGGEIQIDSFSPAGTANEKFTFLSPYVLHDTIVAERFDAALNSWTLLYEARTFAELVGGDGAYVLTWNDIETPTAIMGDGVHGALLPPGTGTVRFSYRTYNPQIRRLTGGTMDLVQAVAFADDKALVIGESTGGSDTEPVFVARLYAALEGIKRPVTVVDGDWHQNIVGRSVVLGDGSTEYVQKIELVKNYPISPRCVLVVVYTNTGQFSRELWDYLMSLLGTGGEHEVVSGTPFAMIAPRKIFYGLAQVIEFRTGNSPDVIAQLASANAALVVPFGDRSVNYVEGNTFYFDQLIGLNKNIPGVTRTISITPESLPYVAGAVYEFDPNSSSVSVVEVD